jgi:hypothetical protein
MGLPETGEVADEEVELLWLTYMNSILRQGQAEGKAGWPTANNNHLRFLHGLERPVNVV